MPSVILLSNGYKVMVHFYYIDKSVLLENRPLVKPTKLHPGLEWRIFHILTSEDIDVVISRFPCTVACRCKNTLVYIIKRKLRGGEPGIDNLVVLELTMFSFSVCRCGWSGYKFLILLWAHAHPVHCSIQNGGSSDGRRCYIAKRFVMNFSLLTSIVLAKIPLADLKETLVSDS